MSTQDRIPQKQMAQALQYSRQFIAKLESRQPTPQDAPTLSLGIEWAKTYARQIVEHEMKPDAAPVEVHDAYLSEYGGEISSFVRNVEGTVHKIVSLLPQVRLFTARNSFALRTDYDEKAFVKEMIDEWRTRTYADFELADRDDNLDENGDFKPTPETQAYTDALARSYGTMLFNLVFDSAMDTSDPENPRPLEQEELMRIVYRASEEWIHHEVGNPGDPTGMTGPKYGAVQFPGSLWGAVEAALPSTAEK